MAKKRKRGPIRQWWQGVKFWWWGLFPTTEQKQWDRTMEFILGDPHFTREGAQKAFLGIQPFTAKDVERIDERRQLIAKEILMPPTTIRAKMAPDLHDALLQSQAEAAGTIPRSYLHRFAEDMEFSHEGQLRAQRTMREHSARRAARYINGGHRRSDIPSPATVAADTILALGTAKPSVLPFNPHTIDPREIGLRMFHNYQRD